MVSGRSCVVEFRSQHGLLLCFIAFLVLARGNYNVPPRPVRGFFDRNGPGGVPARRAALRPEGWIHLGVAAGD